MESLSLILSEGNIHPSLPSIIHHHCYTEYCKNWLPCSCHPRWSVSAGNWQSQASVSRAFFLFFSPLPSPVSFSLLSSTLLFSLWDHQGGAKVTKYLENGRRAIMTWWVCVCSFSPETNCRNLLEVAATAVCSLFPEETHTQTLTPSNPHIFFPCTGNV